jgi:hypothetical protein
MTITVANGAGLRDMGCTNHALVLLALKLVFSLISHLRGGMRAPPATLTLMTIKTSLPHENRSIQPPPMRAPPRLRRGAAALPARGRLASLSPSPPLPSVKTPGQSLGGRRRWFPSQSAVVPWRRRSFVGSPVVGA